MIIKKGLTIKEDTLDTEAEIKEESLLEGAEFQNTINWFLNEYAEVMEALS